MLPRERSNDRLELLVCSGLRIVPCTGFRCVHEDGFFSQFLCGFIGLQDLGP